MIQKDTTARNTACDAIVDLVNQGADYSTGHLSIYAGTVYSDSTRLTWHRLSLPAFGSSVDGTATAYTIYDATSMLDGTASRFAFENRDGSSIWSGNVTAVGMGGSLQLESLLLPKDTTVSITSAVYIVPE
jgi:hypothetical protein